MIFKTKKSSRLHVDTPDRQVYSQFAQIDGWYAGRQSLHRLELDGVAVDSFELVERPDVKQVHPGYEYITGFKIHTAGEPLLGKKSFVLTAQDEGGSRTEKEQALLPNAAWDAKQRRLARMEQLFLEGRDYVKTPTCYDFLDQSSRELGGVVPGTSISSHSYTREMEEMMAEVDAADGWILDCGAGYRETERDNLILFEIEPYVTTDVRGVCERLPFEDDSFDLIFSIVVLEHVRDPFAAMREMERVLKPGGRIWVDVAFMQPFHGYPSHFYNMTKMGLRNLLSDRMELKREFVPAYGTPIWSISWILQRYLSGLPESERDTFLKLTVSDLARSPEYLKKEKWVTALDHQQTEILAATNSIIAQKKPSATG